MIRASSLSVRPCLSPEDTELDLRRRLTPILSPGPSLCAAEGPSCLPPYLDLCGDGDRDDLVDIVDTEEEREDERDCFRSEVPMSFEREPSRRPLPVFASIPVVSLSGAVLVI